MRRGAGRCPRLRASPPPRAVLPARQRPQAVLPCWRPPLRGFLPVGAAAIGAAALRCLSPRCQPRRPQACFKQAAGRLLQAQRLRMRRRCAAWLRLRLPLQVAAGRSRAATVAALPRFCVNDFDVKILPKHNTRSSKPIIRTNNLALIPLLGNHRGRHHMRSGRTRKTKIPDSQNDVHRRAKIGAQNPQKHKTAYRDCVT